MHEKLMRLFLVNLKTSMNICIDATLKGVMVNSSEEQDPLPQGEVAEEVEEIKEEIKKTQEPKKLPNPNRKVYSKAEPPKTKAERDLYKIQWEELGEKGLQEDYLNGKVNSIGESLVEETPVEEAKPEELEDFQDDFAGVESEVEEEKKTFTEPEIRELLMEYYKKNGKEAAYALLAQFGADQISKIKPEDYAAVHKLATSELQ